ncbi:MAG: fibrobacter succinogenes major paralogous domain-containing protein [Bacteroidales bacterium]|nr:fibrobacter succinogenes major paralogous domain-containing protein [Bacteroidales bacterium]
MKTKTILITLITMLTVTALVFQSCQKDEENPVNLTNGKTTAVFNPNKSYGTMIDIDGNIYKTITIGSQTWMAENLRTTKYNDGIAIRTVTDNAIWVYLYDTGAYCNYNNTSNNDSIATFGRLYNGDAVLTGKLAPEGWHVPTDDEWTILTNTLGGDSIACIKLLETGSTHWLNQSSSATNESGFTALPGGYRRGTAWGGGGIFISMGSGCYFWSSSGIGVYENTIWYRRLSNSNNNISCYRSFGSVTTGYSIRCVKD